MYRSSRFSSNKDLALHVPLNVNHINSSSANVASEDGSQMSIKSGFYTDETVNHFNLQKNKYELILNRGKNIYYLMVFTSIVFLGISQSILMTPQHCMYTAILLLMQALHCMYITKFKLL